MKTTVFMVAVALVSAFSVVSFNDSATPDGLVKAVLEPAGPGLLASIVAADDLPQYCCEEGGQECGYDTSHGVENCQASSDPGDCYPNTQDCIEVVVWNSEAACNFTGNPQTYCRTETTNGPCLKYYPGLCISTPSCGCSYISEVLYSWGNTVKCKSTSFICP